MNPLPIFALGLIASGYASAIAGIDADIEARTNAEAAHIVVLPQPALDHLSIYDMPGLTAVDPAAEPHCEPEVGMIAALDHDFAETLVETRVVADGLQMDLYASSLMGTWTLVHSGNDGIACIVNSGTGWTEKAMPADVFAEVELAS